MSRKVYIKKNGITLVEIVIAATILSIVAVAATTAFITFSGEMSQNLSKRLVLQMEARKALTDLYRTIQDGLEVVSPVPGSTLPYLAYRDVVNNVIMVYLEEDKKLTKVEGRKIYRAMIVTKDTSGAVMKKARCFMKHVLSLNFTSYSPGAVLIAANLYSGSGEFALINFVRLQNVSSDSK